MKRWWHRFALLHVIFLVCVAHTSAETPTTCSQPLSVSHDMAAFSAFAHVAADRYGRLHLIWSSGVEVGRNEEQVETDTIFYTVWDENGWQQPLDILSDPDYATADSIVVTQDDRLVVAWHNRAALFVSWVNLAGADSASNWQTHELGVGSVADSALFVDADNRLHLAYAAYDNIAGTGGIGHVRSTDGGVTWSDPAAISAIDPQEAIDTEVRLAVVEPQQVHVAWHRNTRTAQWLPNQVLRAVSTSGGDTWQEPIRVFLGERAAMPNLALGAKPGRLYLNWLRGVGADDSKYLQWSNDGGHTWTGADLVFKNLPGLNGAMPMVADAAGTEYWIMSGDTNAGTQIHYTLRSNNDPWSAPIAISGQLKDSEFPDAAIVRGNQLHVVWNDFVEDDVYHTICTLDAPALTPQPVPPAQPTTAPPTSTPPATLAPSPQPTAVQTAVLPDEPPPPSLSALQPIGLAVLLVVVLVSGVVIWHSMRRR